MAEAPAAAASVVVIDQGALMANYRALAQAAGSAETAAVVKANGYGLGLEPVATALARAGCRTFFVALPEEGTALRRLLPDANIYVLCGPAAGATAPFLAHRLSPVLNDLAQVEIWTAASVGAGAPAAALHLDTGMNRLGLGPADLARLVAQPRLLAGVAIDLVLSHLACGEVPSEPMNGRQLAAFKAAHDALKPLLGPCRASLANSGGILLGPDYAFDLVRAGIALYGADPAARSPGRFRPVAQLLGRILQVRDVDPGMSVGYGATHRVATASRLATVAIGYADGYPRSLSNRGRGFVGATAVPLVGRVSMDLTIFDVTAAPAAAPGTFMELVGPHLSVEDIAASAGTIPYEILTALGRRAHRLVVGG